MNTSRTLTLSTSLAIALIAPSCQPLAQSQGPTIAPQEQQSGLKSTEDIADHLIKTDEDARSWRKLRCDIEGSVLCDGPDCRRTEDQKGVFLVLDRKNNSWLHCNPVACDEYKGAFALSGLCVNVQGSAPIGYMIKVEGKSKFIQVRTVGLISTVSNGNCKEVR